MSLAADPAAARGQIAGGIRRLKWLAAAAGFQLALHRHAYALKANFNPNQPRVPAGRTGGGQWSRDGISGRTNRDKEEESDAQESARAPLRITIYPREYADRADTDTKLPELDLPRELVPLDYPFPDAPDIPDRRPSEAKRRTRIVKALAQWAARIVFRTPLGPVGAIITVVEVARWLHEYYPYIQAYQDPPKSIGELQRAVSQREKGYDIHHIVERAAGFPREMIEAPDNLVRIPTLKHWQLTGWYMTPNKDFGGLTPRAYLKGKDWAEHARVGKIALIKVGVMKP